MSDHNQAAHVIAQRLREVSLLSRLTSELKQMNANARDEIDEDIADPEDETEFSDALDELIQDAENALVALGQPVSD